MKLSNMLSLCCQTALSFPCLGHFVMHVPPAVNRALAKKCIKYL